MIYPPNASLINSLETSTVAASENYKNEHDLLTLVLQEKVSGLEAENKKLKNPWLFVGKCPHFKKQRKKPERTAEAAYFPVKY